MAITFEIVENNKDKIEGALDEAIERALEAMEQYMPETVKVFRTIAKEF